MPFRRALYYSGRSRRREYWLFVLLMLLASSVVSALGEALGFHSDASAASGLLSLLLLIAFLMPGLAVTVRRLHDTDRPGWWAALPIAPPLTWAVLIALHLNFPILFGIMIATTILIPIGLAAMLFLPGTRGPQPLRSRPEER